MQAEFLIFYRKSVKWENTRVTSNLCKRQTTWPKWLKFWYKKCQSILFKTWSISNPCLLASVSKSLTESDNSGGWPCIFCHGLTVMHHIRSLKKPSFHCHWVFSCVAYLRVFQDTQIGIKVFICSDFYLPQKLLPTEFKRKFNKRTSLTRGRRWRGPPDTKCLWSNYSSQQMTLIVYKLKLHIHKLL